MVNFKEISIMIHDSLLRYNQIEPVRLLNRIDWLERAIAYLLAGLSVKKEIAVQEGNEHIAEVLQQAINDLNDVLIRLRSIATDVEMHQVYIKAKLSEFNDPKIVAKLYKYIQEVNKLRNKVVKIAIDTGFEQASMIFVDSEDSESSGSATQSYYE